MRITGYEALNSARHDNVVREGGPVTQGKSPAVTVSTVISGPDRVELSARVRDIQRIQEVVQQTPEMREDRIAEAKTALQSGTLSLGGAELTPKLLATLRHTDVGT